MISWLRYPIYRLLIPFITGIVLSRFLILQTEIPGDQLVIFLSSLLLSGWVLHRVNIFRMRWSFGALITLFMIIMGYLMAKKEFIKLLPHEIDLGEKNYCIARITNLPDEKLKSYKCNVEISGILLGDSVKPAHFKAILYIEKDSASSKIKYDDRLVFYGLLTEIKGSGNPGEFDYAGYVSLKGCSYQAYLPAQAWKVVNSPGRFSLKKWSFKMRDFFLEKIRNLELPETEFAVAAALILGTTDYLEGDLTQSFVASGTIHVLCVSGLHIAIVYLLASSLLGFLRYKKWQIRLRSILALVTVWAYTIITGSGPSSLRAAAMFTIFQVGIFGGRRNDIFNSFSISAFVLLIVHPSLLWDIGFQLSYLAVAGIITFYKEFSEWWKPRPWLLRKVYELSGLAVSAQLTTLPVSLYYFHQFPVYFLPINIFAVPLTTFTLQVSVFYLILSWVDFLAHPFGFFLQFLIRTLIISVTWVEDLPGSLLMLRSLTALEAVLIFMAIWLLYLLILQKTYVIQIIIMVVLIHLAGLEIYRNMETVERRALLVYNSRDATLLSFIDGTMNCMLIDSRSDSLKTTVMEKYGRSWKNLSLRVNTLIGDSLSAMYYDNVISARGNFIKFHDKRILLVTDSTSLCTGVAFPDSLDLLVIGGIPRYKDPGQILTAFPSRQVVISATCRPWVASKCDTVCRQFDIPCHIVSESGAYLQHF